MPHRVLLLQRDPRIRAVYTELLATCHVTAAGTADDLVMALQDGHWDAILVSSPIGREGTWRLAVRLLEGEPDRTGHMVVVAAGDPPPDAPDVLHLQPSCTRDDLREAVQSALAGRARPFAERQRHRLRWVVPETYAAVVDRAASPEDPS